jgi:hypothetical protein
VQLSTNVQRIAGERRAGPAHRAAVSRQINDDQTTFAARISAISAGE